MKRIKVTLLIWAALAMLAVPSFANAPATVVTVPHAITQAQCEQLGGEWHCFLNGRCSCY
jgi:hypothetical protein